MIKLRFVFLIIFVFVILVPIQQYLNLSEQRDLFVEASQIRSQSSEKIIAPRKTIVDRNQNELAISIQRPTLELNFWPSWPSTGIAYIKGII